MIMSYDPLCSLQHLAVRAEFEGSLKIPRVAVIKALPRCALHFSAFVWQRLQLGAAMSCNDHSICPILTAVKTGAT